MKKEHGEYVKEMIEEKVKEVVEHKILEMVGQMGKAIWEKLPETIREKKKKEIEEKVKEEMKKKQKKMLEMKVMFMKKAIAHVADTFWTLKKLRSMLNHLRLFLITNWFLIWLCLHIYNF